MGRIYDFDEVFDCWTFLTEYEIATQEELQLVTAINGTNVETMEDVLYVRTGYRSFAQYAEEELNAMRVEDALLSF